ncbi:MAG: PEP-CTERM-box response regulator transcription factor [Burkholderiaceae bacterium]
MNDAVEAERLIVRSKVKETDSKQVLLVVEDDPGIQKQMRWSFDQYDVVVADDRASAMAQLRRYEPAVVTMDLGLPPDPDSTSEGFALLAEMLSASPDTKVIMITGQNDRTNAVKAIGLGAYDFYTKPFEPELLTLVVERAFRLAGLQRENGILQSVNMQLPLAGLLTRDPAMLRICRNIERLAPSDVTVLLLGESGTGKELLARGLHDLSNRKDKKFIALNCAAIPENLLESELFGYERGAFTGAAKQTKGKIEYADGGTLFLDEIGDLPGALQAKLLRFLQERVVERIGGREEIPVDVRIVCATHQNLKEQIKVGRFREDLFYRLSEIVVDIPPLRQRHGDASLLARAFIQRFSAAQNRKSLVLADGALAAIEAYGWPGNVREIENCMKRAVIMSDGQFISAEELALDVEGAEPKIFNLRQVRDDAERGAIMQVLGKVDGNIARAAEMLGVSRPTLYDLMRRFGIR